jgi:hypothetical protein
VKGFEMADFVDVRDSYDDNDERGVTLDITQVAMVQYWVWADDHEQSSVVVHLKSGASVEVKGRMASWLVEKVNGRLAARSPRAGVAVADRVQLNVEV